MGRSRLGDEQLKRIQHYLTVSDDAFTSILKEEMVPTFHYSTGDTTQMDLMIYQAWLEYVWVPYIGRRPLDVSLPYIENMTRRYQIFLLLEIVFFIKMAGFWKLVRMFTCTTQLQFAEKLFFLYRDESLLRAPSPYRLSEELRVAMITRIIRHERGCPEQMVTSSTAD